MNDLVQVTVTLTVPRESVSRLLALQPVTSLGTSAAPEAGKLQSRATELRNPKRSDGLQPGQSCIATVVIPRAPSLKKPSTITVGGVHRTVPASVAKILANVAAGAQIAQMRPDTFRALVAAIPEIAGLFKRDPRKMVAKQAFWNVTGGAEAVRFEA